MSETSLPGSLEEEVEEILASPNARLEAMLAHKFQHCVFTENYAELKKCFRYQVRNVSNLKGENELYAAASLALPS